jgi:translation initiation factor 2 beta subunit (eIF-2beta)/eIF-5
MKTCSICNLEKPLSEFHRTPVKTNRDGYRSNCKRCRKKIRHREYVSAQKYRDANVTRTKAIRLTRFWPGSTWREALAKYMELLAKQDNKCAICKRPETTKNPRNGKPKELAVDHCHATGKVRGVLCDKCNRAIGMLSDSVEACLTAAEYLNKHK